MTQSCVLVGNHGTNTYYMMADPDSEVEHFASSSDESDPEIEVERVGGRVNPYQYEPARTFRVRDGEEPRANRITCHAT